MVRLIKSTNKGEINMGLDQYAGLRDSNGEVHEKFYWRKHARLQVFMSKQYQQTKATNDQEHNTHDDLQHLGFNGGQGGVTITEDVIKDLEEAIKNDYYNHFASDGFFWGQQFQEEQVKEYKAQDKEFLKWAKEQVKSWKTNRLRLFLVKSFEGESPQIFWAIW
jgi:hypothetical protein